MNQIVSPKITLIPLARPTFDIPLAEERVGAARAQLAAAGMDVTGPDELVMDCPAAEAAAAALHADPPDCLLILQATFADSTMLQALAAATTAPILLWALPEEPDGGRLRLNSYCGVNLGAHALRLSGRFYRSMVAPVGETAVTDRLHTLSRAGQLARRLQKSRIGLVGSHPAGMDSCHLDGVTLREQLGVQVERLPLPEIFVQMRAVSGLETAPVREKLAARLPNLDALPPAPLQGTLAAYTVFAEELVKRGLDGLAVRCWPEFFEEMGCAACGALSLLNDQLQPAACEADVNGTITQLLLQWASGTPAFGADVVARQAAHDGIVIWHCGKAPLSMADPATPPRGGLHSNRKVPLVFEFPLKPGPVTVARLSRTGGDGRLRLVLGQGEMVAAPNSFAGTSGVLRFTRPALDVMQTILDEGLEHHIAITYGEFGDVLTELAAILDLPVLRID
jgi:L-fucose isomerase-like protein